MILENKKNELFNEAKLSQEGLIENNNIDDFSIQDLKNLEIVNHKISEVLYDKFRETPYYNVQILIGENDNYGSVCKHVCLFNSDFEFIEDTLF